MFAVLTVVVIFFIIVLFNQTALRKAYHHYKISRDSEYIHQLLLAPEGSPANLVLIDISKKEEGRLTLVKTLLEYYTRNKKKLQVALDEISKARAPGQYHIKISFNFHAGKYVEFIHMHGRIMSTMRTNFGPEPPERIQQIRKVIRLLGGGELKFKNKKYPKLQFSFLKGGAINAVPEKTPQRAAQ